MTLIVSHTLLGGLKMRFTWEKEIVQELVRFGRWIFISTALGFLVARADIFILGGFATLSTMGFFAIAKNLSRLATEALSKLSSMVLLPVYSRLVDRQDESLRHEMFKTRVSLLILSLPPLWIFIIWGEDLIALLYTDRYYEAGWMLQILAVGATANVITLTMYPILLAVGDSFRHMLKTVIRLIFQMLGMAIGGYIWGIPGFIVGLALTDWLSYPFGAYLVHRYGGWLPFLDAIAFGSTLIVIVIAFWP
jgi:O-antigen/teichoic acid export membrane protein